jgi:predicted transcriptional regulator
VPNLKGEKLSKLEVNIKILNAISEERSLGISEIHYKTGIKTRSIVSTLEFLKSQKCIEIKTLGTERSHNCTQKGERIAVYFRKDVQTSTSILNPLILYQMEPSQQTWRGINARN